MHHVVTAIIILTFVVAEFIDVVLLPDGYIVSSLYAIPILIAGHRARPKIVAVVILIAIAVYLGNDYIEDRPSYVWPFGVLGMLIVGYLTLYLSMQRQAIARHVAELERARRELQEFLGMVSHDLAGSMTGVLGCAELLTRGSDGKQSEETRWVAEALDNAAAQMRRLLTDLREASAIGAGHFTIQPVETDLVAITQQAVAQQQSTTSRHQIQLRAASSITGSWDPERVGQLLTNLISNAIKFSPDGTDISVTIDERGDEAVIAVHDRGPGIAPEERERLFEPFARLKTQQAIPGTGLGLCIAQAVAQAHGGQVTVESEVGRGSTFSAILPGRIASQARDTVLDDAPRSTPSPAAGEGAVVPAAWIPVSALTTIGPAGQRSYDDIRTPTRIEVI